MVSTIYSLQIIIWYSSKWSTVDQLGFDESETGRRRKPCRDNTNRFNGNTGIEREMKNTRREV